MKQLSMILMILVTISAFPAKAQLEPEAQQLIADALSEIEIMLRNPESVQSENDFPAADATAGRYSIRYDRVLERAQTLKSGLASHGVRITGISVTIGIAPSLSISFEFPE